MRGGRGQRYRRSSGGVSRSVELVTHMYTHPKDSKTLKPHTHRGKKYRSTRDALNFRQSTKSTRIVGPSQDKSFSQHKLSSNTGNTSTWGQFLMYGRKLWRDRYGTSIRPVPKPLREPSRSGRREHGPTKKQRNPGENRKKVCHSLYSKKSIFSTNRVSYNKSVSTRRDFSG
jgi:hypothetical protein